MIKPLRPLVLLVYVGLLIALVMYVVPEEWQLSKEVKLKFFTYQTVFGAEEPIAYKDIASLKDNFDPAKREKAVAESKGDSLPAPDSVRAQKFDASVYARDTLYQRIKIFYPENQDTALFAFLESLYQLDQARNPKHELVRVLHFGDSQLEGDRMTMFLRNRFQEKFGGCGAGLQGLNNSANSKISIAQKNDKRWQIYPVFGKAYSKKLGGYFGLLGNLYKWGNVADSTGQMLRSQASATYFRSGAANLKDQKADNIKILYRTPQAPCKITVKQDGAILEQEELERSEEFSVHQVALQGDFNQVQVQFEAAQSPEVYGITFDCQEGITFDNVPIRGSSGLEFTKINEKHFRKQVRDLNVRLAIVQFGVNVDQKLSDYTFYENALYAQLRYLKSLSPRLSILVIGTSDRSYNKAGSYVSYAGVSKIRDAQRNAAFRAGCAFWDLYEVMGGENSMPSWVFNKPPLAEKDFTHFTFKGAGIVGEMLYEALMYEYEKYKRMKAQ